MASIYDSLHWRNIPLPGTAAAPDNHLSVGEIGDGSPSALLIAGTHGDEGPWSALAIRSFLDSSSAILRGRLSVVFTANPLAAQANARNAPVDSPNCVDLDGCFPGNSAGSHSERIASVLAPIVAGSDIILDLHGGGSWCVNAFTKEFEGSEILTRAFGAPFFSPAPNKPGGLTTYGRGEGAKVINVEMGGRGKNEPSWTERILHGIERALHNTGVVALAHAPESPSPGTPVGPTAAVRSSSTGVFVPTVGEDDVGTVVRAGTVLGRVLSLDTFGERETISAPYRRTALMLLRPHVCVIETGALLYVVAEPKP